MSKLSRSKASGASVSNHTWHGNTIKPSRSPPSLSSMGDGHGYAPWVRTLIVVIFVKEADISLWDGTQRACPSFSRKLCLLNILAVARFPPAEVLTKSVDTPVLLGETRLLPGEHDPSSSVSLTASRTPRRPAVPRTDGPTALVRIPSTTRGLGALHGISPEDAVQISCTAVSIPRTRNLWELVGPLAVLSSCKSEQAHRTAVLKVVSPLLSSSCCQR